MPSSDARTLEYLDLNQLKFDPENPRLPSGRSTDQGEILRYLLETANLLDLMRSIASQGFFPGEPLLVTKDDSSPEVLTVVEGNRRFAACWLLSHPGDAPVRRRAVEQIVAEAEFRPNSLPCLVLPESEIVGFLGYRHITGIQEWSPLAKARYLARLWNDDEGPEGYDERLRWIARRIGSRSDYVARLLTALQLYSEIEEASFFGVPDLNEETLSFSLLALAMNRPDLANFLGLSSGQDFELVGLDTARLEQLTKWFFAVDDVGRTPLGESRNVSMLVAVVKDSRALAAFTSGMPLASAYQLSQDSETGIDSYLRSGITAVETIISVLDGDTTAMEMDVELSQRLRDLVEELLARLPQLQA
ncbi:hypothetical protein [Promicromonospora soli]